MPLRPRTGDSTLEVARGPGSEGFNRVGKVLKLGNPGKELDASVELFGLILVLLSACLGLAWLWWALTF